MFTQAAPPPLTTGIPPPLTLSNSNPSSTSSSSGRTSRLRGLIHLRSYHGGPPPRSPRSLENQTSTDNNSLTRRETLAPHPTRSSSFTSRSTARRLVSTSAAPDDFETEPLNRPLTLYVDATDAPPSTSTYRRHSTRFSEAASEALLTSRSGLNSDGETAAIMTRTRSATTGDPSYDALPSIRFSAFYDARSNRPSLSFSPVSRTLPTGSETIKVGRYSERENNAPVPINTPSAAPVGFKSKVVSRRHCEFWHEHGTWYIRDVKSSSGTFLNHIRLSAPGTESKPFPMNDGDIVQLGIDFKGGEEMIYRCVKMRIELNRGWQNKPNTFNMATHKRLRDLASTSSSSHTQDCSICLNAIAPCQSLFVAPCSHTWHYKCIREILNGPQSPIFICPNCRATGDLDADVEEQSDEWQQLDLNMEDAQDEQPSSSSSKAVKVSRSSTPHPNSNLNASQSAVDEDMGEMTILLNNPIILRANSPMRRAATDPVPIPNSTPRTTGGGNGERRTPSPNANGLGHHEGPITPRNDAGPWVFDGNPERVSQESSRRNGMRSLDAATNDRTGQS